MSVCIYMYLYVCALQHKNVREKKEDTTNSVKCF